MRKGLRKIKFVALRGMMEKYLWVEPMGREWIIVDYGNGIRFHFEWKIKKGKRTEAQLYKITKI
jgi:hypothetical protein